MRRQNGVQYSHTRLELRVGMQRDGRFDHLSVSDLNEAISRYGVWKDICECPSMLERIFLDIFRKEHGYIYKEIYYKPWETMRNVIDETPNLERPE